MERNEIIDVLTLLYDRRLKALLCYRNDLFTRELVEYMLTRFDEIEADEEYRQPCFASEMRGHISDVLQYDGALQKQADALLSTGELTLALENYIKCTLRRFWPEEAKKLPPPKKNTALEVQQQEATSSDSFDYRKYISEQFSKKLEESPSRFPNKQFQKNIINQLRNTVKIRNEEAHTPTIGYTSMFNRYQYLKAFDVLLAYLLYTFYHLIFAGGEKNYLTETERHESE